jgi:hypothetical protein
MTQKEATKQAAKLLPELKGKAFREITTGKLIKVANVTAKPTLKQPENWDVYAETGISSKEGEHTTFFEISYSLLLKECVQLD